MTKLWIWMRSLRRDESGATAIEYGLLAALISVVIIGSVFLVGQNLLSVFSTIATCLATPGAACPGTTI